MFSIDVTITSYFLYGPGLTGYIIGCFLVCVCLTLALVTAIMRTKEPSTHEQSSGDNENIVPKQPYYIEVWAVLELKIIRGIKESAELKSNFVGNLGTVAVVGALFGGANLASFMSGVSEVYNKDVGEFIGSFRFTAACAGLISAVYSSVIMVMMNAIPKVIYFKGLYSLLYRCYFLRLEIASPTGRSHPLLFFIFLFV